MTCRVTNGRFLTGILLSGFMLAVASCQSGDGGSGGGVLSGGVLGGGDKKEKAAEDGKVLMSDLVGYCPKVSLREGTAYYNTYAKGGQDDKSKIIYQASITDVTRNCTRANGQLTINVAVAGKVVAGPLGKAGNINMPIRIVVLRGGDVLYSQLHQHQVASDGSTATQFVFNDPNATVPDPSAADLQVFAGFDEGPPKKKPAAEAL